MLTREQKPIQLFLALKKAPLSWIQTRTFTIRQDKMLHCVRVFMGKQRLNLSIEMPNARLSVLFVQKRRTHLNDKALTKHTQFSNTHTKLAVESTLVVASK